MMGIGGQLGCLGQNWYIKKDNWSKLNMSTMQLVVEWMKRDRRYQGRDFGVFYDNEVTPCRTEHFEVEQWQGYAHKCLEFLQSPRVRKD